MIRCTMDVSVEEESQCAKCCVHCDKVDCEQRCINVKKYGPEEDNILLHCTVAYEW